MKDNSQALRKLKALSEMIRELQIRTEERIKARHGRFNVFTTLLSVSDEVRLHTRFLHELLNPEGTHDCGNLFLKLFFDTLKANAPTSIEDREAEAWDEYSTGCFHVGKEVRKEQGQLDLLLESETHILVIENKIWATEGNRQIARYAEYIKSQQSKKGLVIYLTLDGRESFTHGNNDYLRISYKKHIMAWLELCLKATYHIIPINQALIQYRNVVKELTGQSTDTKTMEKIKDFIRKNPIILDMHNEITTAVEEIKVERKQTLKQRFADALTKSLSDYFHVTLRPNMTESSFAVDDNAGLVIRRKENDFTAEHPFSVWVEHNKWGALCIGIEAKWSQERELTPCEQALLVKMKDILSKTCQNEGLNFYGIDKTWYATYWPVGVHDLIKPFFDEQTIERISKDPDLELEIVKTADAGIRNYMRILEDSYTQAKEETASLI